jgi:ribosome-associated heat shock protein Hsp15
VREEAQLEAGLRLDLWLWYVRFYKTRGLATEAVKGGQVRVNGMRPKPARAVLEGDWVEITKEEQRLRVEVLALPSRRGPAPEAARCYREDPQSKMRREAEAEQRRLQRYLAPGTPGRPDRRTRRKLRDIKQG